MTETAAATAMISPAADSPGTEATSAGKGLAFVVSGGDEAGLATRQAVLAGDGALPASVREDLLLLVTELVTNAVRHGDVGPERSLGIELRRLPRRVRVEVVDPGASFTPPRARSRGSESGGWGLFLIDRIADRWGVRRMASGTCAWFELRLEE
jgi:anti-sigma regulatory factor (Ser/Thr protein kinase)